MNWIVFVIDLISRNEAAMVLAQPVSCPADPVLHFARKGLFPCRLLSPEILICNDIVRDLKVLDKLSPIDYLIKKGAMSHLYGTYTFS